MMSKNVKKLPSAVRAEEDAAAVKARQAAIVSILGKLKELAEAGAIDGLVCVLSYAPESEHPESYGTVVAPTWESDPALWLGRLEILKQRIFFGHCEIPELEGFYAG